MITSRPDGYYLAFCSEMVLIFKTMSCVLAKTQCNSFSLSVSSLLLSTWFFIYLWVFPRSTQLHYSVTFSGCNQMISTEKHQVG